MRELDLSEKNFRSEYYSAEQNDRIIPRGKSDFEYSQLLNFKMRRYFESPSANKYHKIIIEAISESINSDWFSGLTEQTRIGYKKHISYFYDWMSIHDTDRCSETRYKCLDDYASFRTGKLGVKHSGVIYIKNLLNIRLDGDELSQEKSLFLTQLVRLTKKIKRPDQKSYTLTEWFNIPWLRHALGENKYFQLESPSRLINSFRIAIAVTLSLMLEARQQWQAHNIKATIRLNNPRWWAYYNSEVLGIIGKFDESGDPADALTNLLWIDYVTSKRADELRSKVGENQNFIFPNTFRYWQMPLIFKPDYHLQYSLIEQRLAAWLAACEAIQPNDITKLKSSDYAPEYNSKGRLILLQCNYYKGRAGNYKQPSILMATDSWTQSFHKYMELMPNSGYLFSKNVMNGLNIPNIGIHAKNNTEFHFLFRLWKSNIFQKMLSNELLKSKGSTLFIDAMLALESGGKSYSSHRLNINDYETKVEKSLPPFLFRFSHIKTTAVHAESDMYRESDLVNHHSHSSEVEKHSYLSDSNKEWVNQCGRITRLVLNDLQNVVYQPCLHRIQQTEANLELRTKVINATGSSDIDILSLPKAHLQNIDDDDEIIVVDTFDTALYFVHYLNQAELCSSRLINLRPDFVEKSLLPKIEWITRTLHRMKSAKSAIKRYSEYEKYLPPVFEHFFETSE